MEPTTFRPRRIGGVLGLILGLPTFAFGLVAPSLEEVAPSAEPGIWVFVAVVGATAVYCGAGHLCMRTVVDNTGLRRSPFWFDRFQVCWADVVSWSIEPLDPIDNPDGCQVLCVRACRRFWSIRIADYQVGRPGFEALVEQVRARLAERERTREAQSWPSGEETHR